MNPIRGWFREIESIFSFNRTRGLATAVASRSQAGRNLKQGCGGVAILASSCHVLIIFPLMRSTCPTRSIDPYAAAHLSKGPLSKNENPVGLKRIPVNQASIRGIDLVYSGLLLIFLRSICNFSFVHENILYLKHAILLSLNRTKLLRIIETLLLSSEMFETEKTRCWEKMCYP